jgi:hypothetical protein
MIASAVVIHVMPYFSSVGIPRPLLGWWQQLFCLAFLADLVLVVGDVYDKDI